MTREEIKQAYSMKDILVKCGLPGPNRAGFIKCPFHKGDHEASMKIYDNYNDKSICNASLQKALGIQIYCSLRN